MRRLLSFLAAVMTAILLAWSVSTPALTSLARKALRRAMPQTTVKLSRCSLAWPFALELSGLTVKDASADAQIRSIRFIPMRSELRVEDADILLRSWGSSSKPSAAPSPHFPLRSISLKNIRVSVRSERIQAEMTASLQMDLSTLRPESWEIRIPSAKSGALSLENFYTELKPGQTRGHFVVQDLRYDKIKTERLSGDLIWRGRVLRAALRSGTVLGGQARGSLEAAFSRPVRFRGALSLTRLSIPSLVRDLKLTDKFEMTGDLSGVARIEGSSGIRSLSGSFHASPSGGDLYIRDRAFLENIAQRTGQPIELVDAGLKDYHYRTGSVRLFLDKAAVGVAVDMDGEKGKRNLEVRLHDWL